MSLDDPFFRDVFEPEEEDTPPASGPATAPASGPAPAGPAAAATPPASSPVVPAGPAAPATLTDEESDPGLADEQGYFADSEKDEGEPPTEQESEPGPADQHPEPKQEQELEGEAQCPDGCLPPVPNTAQRINMHYVFYRTNNPEDRQPESFTQEQFWEHLKDCYRKAYPAPGAKTGSILAYGMVAKERHKDSQIEASRSAHHHGAAATTMRHYWSKVVKESRKVGVHLHAVEHHTYGSMYKYLRAPTKKKPLHELDPKPFISPEHPEGDALKELLEKAEVAAAAWAARGKKQPVAGQGAE